TTLQALERATRENNVLSERLGAIVRFSGIGNPSQIWLSHVGDITMKSLCSTFEIAILCEYLKSNSFTGLNRKYHWNLESIGIHKSTNGR
ncbi:hypothetical protein DOY81_012231, partial [Sarcophaga bullata]